MDSLKIFLRHGWHFNVLFSPSTENVYAVQPHLLLYTLSASMCRANVRQMRERIHHLSFVEIRDPNERINSQLHDVREHLACLKAGVTQTITWAPRGLDEYFKFYHKHGSKAPPPVEKLRELLAEVRELEAVTMETFQLLMSSLSVRDSQVSIQQSRRATLLTALAFVYVPLSFVTGIFGMNIKEINGSPLDVWVCFAAFAALILLTALGYAMYVYARHLRACIRESTVTRSWKLAKKQQHDMV
ncbi:hypothetical protein LTR36_006931 [Oleoguttula mirabilis]|uniref:Uncharacterized protein n=1 Tax=Oleoguttula mirabilis TaxID=1507867 RepID=A0AAV9JAU5_9PEZI|nr:hypothetical protein LTR36_006931 [Oleoguttula mirabilis]